MKKTLIYATVTIIGLGLIVRLALEIPSLREGLLLRAASTVMSQKAEIQDDSLHVFMCGTGSPLPAAGVAQVCVAILTKQHFYIVDTGAGSINNINEHKLPVERMQSIFLTHFHSDHIAEIPDFNLISWVRGRPEPLKIIGPSGVRQIVDGSNMAYAADRSYRVAHHSAELLNPELGILASQEVAVGDVLTDGDMRIEVFATNHSPVSPTVGYKFSYKGRSVVITGDSLITESIKTASRDVDLVLSDALSLPIVKTLQTAAGQTGGTRMEKIFLDIQDYHASVSDVVAFAKDSDAKLTALYHQVPAPTNYIMSLMYEAELGSGVIMTKDGQWFILPAGGDDIIIKNP